MDPKLKKLVDDTTKQMDLAPDWKAIVAEKLWLYLINEKNKKYIERKKRNS